jgi:BirA family biotin operon repressor/biotin-[acetyl-CoA-carboxylase] ligase
VNIPLLRTLQAAPEETFWPESLARTLGISPKRLLRDLRELEEFGFEFENQPHRGVRYAHPAKRLCVDQIEWELNPKTIGRRLSVWRRTTSTNDIAARAATSRSNDGLVVLAEEQTAGRGRRQRIWFAPPQTCILMSALVFPPETVRHIVLLTSLAAVAVAELLRDELDLPARIKWPNDVRVDGQKVCGILVEDIIRQRSARSNSATRSMARRDGATAHRAHSVRRAWRASVIGIGVNVNVPVSAFPYPLDNPATSLMELCGRRLDRSDLVHRLLQRLDQIYHAALAGDTGAIWKRWHAVADLVGQRVRVTRARDTLHGRLVVMRPPDHIALRLSSGQILNLAADQVLSISDAGCD